MQLTREDSIRIAIELWTWLAETGAGHKINWDGWKEYGEMGCDCPLCEYSWQEKEPDVVPGAVCNDYCPYYQKFGACFVPGKLYNRWGTVVTTESKKKYAALFLEQLKQL